PAREKAHDRSVPPDNKNSLVKEHFKDLKLSASSFWPGWPVENAFDDNIETSWFTAQDDAVAQGTKPWIEVTFPRDVTVRRVTILGNRDPAWLKGYTILSGKVELLDKDSKCPKSKED